MPISYEAARRDYLNWFGLLLEPLELDLSGGNVIVEMMRLITGRLDGYNLASETLLAATQPFFTADDHAFRNAALDSLLHQIEGDLAVAAFIWNVILLDQEADPDDLPDILQEMLRRSSLRVTYRHLQAEIPPQFESLVAYYRQIKPDAKPDLPLDAVLDTLRFEIDDTIDQIQHEVVSLSLRLLRQILPDAEWRLMVRGIDLLQGEQKIGRIAWGLDQQVPHEARHLADELRSTLINIVTRIFTITRSNEFVRYILEDWLEDLHQAESHQQREVFTRLLEQLYGIEDFRNKTLERWLIDAVNPACIQNTSAAVRQLGKNFKRIAAQIRRVGELAENTPLLQHEQVKVTANAIEIGLLGILIFAGFDHLDEGANIMNITRGIKEILIVELPVSRQTLEATR